MINDEIVRQLLDDLIPLIQRFPELPVSNASYNRNFVELLINLYQVEQRFAGHLKELRPAQTLRTGIRYQEHGDGTCDSAKLKRLKRLLQDDYRPLHQHLGGRFQSIETDLARLKRSQGFDSLAKKLIRVSPLLYTAAGEALPVPYFDQTRFPGPEELQQSYYDTFKTHLSQLFMRLSERPGYGEVRRFVGNVINQFIPKQVIPATTRYTSDSQPVSEREIYLEEIPPLYTPLRGAMAYDCSMVTVPYFGILKHTRVFWVSRTASGTARPDGYLFVAEVKLGEELLPYVITINGLNLDETDCRAICHLLQSLYRGQTLLIADVRKVPYLVNSPRIADAMAAMGGSDVCVAMPQGWSAVSDWSVNTIAYQNYYELSRLTRPRVVRSEKLTLFGAHVVSPVYAEHYPKQRIAEVSLINRSIIAYYFLRCSGMNVNEDILMNILQLRPVHLQNADCIIDLHQGATFKVEHFEILQTYFEFTIQDYACLPSSTRANTLAELYSQHSSDPSISRQQWGEVCRKTFDELKAIADEGFERGDRDTILQQMASIPDEFIAEYWDVIAPYLMRGENRPDYFLLRPLVKYFESPHTVIRFLEFLDQHPQATEAVKPEDPQWFDYLSRAHSMAAQHAALPRLFQTLFHDQPLNGELSMTAYEVDKRYQAATSLGWNVSESLVKAVYRKRGWQ